MKTRIRFLINSLAGGGAEKVLVELLRQLDPEKYELSLVSVLGGVHAQALPEGIQYRCIVSDSSTPWGKLISKCVFKLPPKWFNSLFMREQYDIEVAYLEGIPTRFVAAVKGNVTKIAFVHCDLSAKNQIRSFYKDTKECLDEYRGFDKVCFVSEESKKGFFAAIGPLNNACVVHNVLDFERIQNLSRESVREKYQTTGMRLISVGRLTEPKAYDRLLYIIKELEKDFDFELWIVGEGEQREELERIIAQQNIQSVRLLGYQTNPYAYMKQADLFVCSSIYEGYSTVVTEALALGVPVITTDCAGMKEILSNGAYGKIVENDPQALQNGLREILQNRLVYEDLKQKALKKSEMLTSHQAIQEYEQILTKT